MSHPSMLSALRQHVIIDLDSMDPSVALRYTSDKFTFCDMTSNQAIVYSEASKPERKNILTRACRGVKGPDTNLEQQVESALTVLVSFSPSSFSNQLRIFYQTVLLAKEIYPSLTGRIHIQTSPTNAYDTKATIIDAKKLVDVFESIGIPRHYFVMVSSLLQKQLI